MLYQYSNGVSLYFDEEESWMIHLIDEIGEKLIANGLNSANQKSLFELFEENTTEKDTSVLYGKLLPKIIAYISRCHYSILSTTPLYIKKYK